MTWQDDIRALSTSAVTRSSEDSSGMIHPRPEELLAQARRLYPTLTLDEYTAGRLAVSEYGSGGPEELAAIIDAELNRARRRGRTLFNHLTGGTGRFWNYGEADGKVPASTRRDPGPRHIGAAFQVMRPAGQAHGISQGAERFFDPAAQFFLHKRDGVSHPLLVLEAWAYDKRQVLVGGQLARPRRLVGGNEAEPWRSGVGRDLEEWVGPIPGIDAYKLMLFRPAAAGDAHNAAYLAARKVIISKAGLPPIGAGVPPDLIALLAFLGAGWALAQGILA